MSLCGVDGTETYRPETRIVMDVISGYTVFAKENAKSTMQSVTAAARKICNVWNTKHSSEEVGC